MGSHFLIQGIFLTQGSNPSLLHYRQILYNLSHQGSPLVLTRPWARYPHLLPNPGARDPKSVSLEVLEPLPWLSHLLTLRDPGHSHPQGCPTKTGSGHCSSLLEPWGCRLATFQPLGGHLAHSSWALDLDLKVFLLLMNLLGKYKTQLCWISQVRLGPLPAALTFVCQASTWL